MTSSSISSPPKEFFIDPQDARILELEKNRIPIPVGTMILEYTLPKTVIFLQPNEVLFSTYGWEFSRKFKSLKDIVIPTLHKLFTVKPDDEYTLLEWKIAYSHDSFSNTIPLFEQMISTASKSCCIAIVIHSFWKEDLTTDDFRTKIFDNCSFSKLIIDCTPYSRNRQHRELAKRKYNIDLEPLHAHGAIEIEFWLKENASLDVKNFVILDYSDRGYREKYPKNVVITDQLLDKKDIKQACAILEKETLPETAAVANS